MNVVAIILLSVAVLSGAGFVLVNDQEVAEFPSLPEDESLLPPCEWDSATNCRITDETKHAEEYNEPSAEQNNNPVQQLPLCPSPTATNCTPRETYNEQSRRTCSGEGTVALASPMKLEDIGMVIPMGLMVGGHVTPIDHMYFQPTVFHSAPDTYEVYANADGIIKEVGLEGFVESTGGNKKYRLTVYHTCDFYSIYNLLTSTSEKIEEITGELSRGQSKSVSIAVKKGELLGKIGGQTLDLSVNYDKHVLSGFVVPEHYNAEPWKIHTVDPFDYFEEPDRSQLLAKNVRTVEPWGGKIDYDIDGRLVGNWFVEGTGGYRSNADPYWSTHLSFAYEHIDPSLVIVSIGEYNGDTAQFAVKGNSPDPADVSVSTGVVEYGLVQYDYEVNGQPWDRMTPSKNIGAYGRDDVHGVVLVQMLSDRKLKFEAFPGKTASQVSDFTSNANVYER